MIQYVCDDADWEDIVRYTNAESRIKDILADYLFRVYDEEGLEAFKKVIKREFSVVL